MNDDLSVQLADARRDWQAGRHASARGKLESILTADKHLPGANALMLEVLFALREMGRAAPFLARALAENPADLRLQVLRGEHALACGDLACAEQVFRAVLSTDRNRSGAWAGLVSVHCRQADGAQAFATLREGLAVLADPLQLWWPALEALRSLTDPGWLAQAATLLPCPEPGAQRLRWARPLLAVGVLAPLAALLAEILVDDVDTLTIDEAAIFSDVALATGDIPAACRLRARALHNAGADDPRLRRLWLECLWSGDLAGAEAVLARMGEKVRYRLGLQPMYEARVFASVMTDLQSAWSRDAATRLIALATLLRDEPQCVNVAVALLHCFRGIARERQHGDQSIPSRAWSVSPKQDVVDGLRLGHGDSLADPSVRARARALWLSRAPDLADRRISTETLTDLARLSLLWRRGGWWLDDALAVPAAGAARLTSLGGVVTVQQEDGLLHPGFVGAVAGHEALSCSLEEAVAAVRDSPPRDYTRWESGAAALTLGVARHLASRLIDGDPVTAVRVFRQADVARELPGLPAWA